MMRKRVEYYKRDHWFDFAIGIKTPYEEDRHHPHNLLRIAMFGHSWWIKIPQLIKPKTKWVDLSDEPWAKPGKDGRKGYFETIQRGYSISCDKESLHIYYGIQPGQWIRNDLKNSDHVKVFWWPWRLDIVRHDLLFPNGDLYHRNTYPRKNQTHIRWWEVLDGDVKCDTQVEVAKFVTLNHTTKSGEKQVAKVRLAGEEREWRPKWTRWLPMFKFTKRTVDCYSDIELGEKAGSWKGGMIGWSCEWRKGETLEQAFDRWYAQWNGV